MLKRARERGRDTKRGGERERESMLWLRCRNTTFNVDLSNRRISSVVTERMSKDAANGEREEGWEEGEWN